jgi:polyhydroxybutyrate depolymerase
MVLHGGGSGDATSARDRLQFDEIGDTANFITVFPYGYFNDWADGRKVTASDSAGIDDVSFLSALKDTMSYEYSIDTSKTYICGPSNGGMMTLRVACEKPESFAAYAAIISSMPDSVAISCNPGIPISVLLMPGTDDPFIPYEGGTLNPLSDGGSVIGVDSTINTFLLNNGCTNPIPDIYSFPDINQNDNSSIISYSYGFCNDSSEVVLYKVIGGGHTIPGMEASTNPLPLIGYVNYDIDAAVEIWNFFKRHVKNDSNPSGILREYDNHLHIKIYPNPTSQYCDIEFIDHDTDFQINIYNMLGVKVLEFSNQRQIDVSSLTSGTYFLSIVLENEAFITKIIKTN